MDENGKLTLGSLFSGSGAFELGGLLAGIRPVWASEIEMFPIRVTTKRLPFVKHYGDVNSIRGDEIEPVDIITSGSPCTDLSIAGKRAGLDGRQSGLFYQAIRIIKEMRCATDGRYPRFIVWENVPGAFSSNNGEDFRAVLEAVCSVKDGDIPVPGPPRGKWANAGCVMADGFSLAWRVVDACLWGVPQRRKRIYLVADFAGGSAGKVLFESEGVSGYSAEGFRAWKGAAGGAAPCIGETGGIRVCLNDQGGSRMDVTDDVTCTLRAEAHHPPCVLEQAVFGNRQPSVVETPKTMKIRAGKSGGGKGILLQDDKSATLSCNNDQTVFVPSAFDTGENRCNELVVQAFGICSKESNAMKSDNPHSGFYEAQTARTLDCNCNNPSSNQGGIAVVAYPTYCTSKNSYFMRAEKELANTRVATNYNDPPLINAWQTASGKEVFGTISASMGSKQWLGNQEAFSGDYHIVEPDYIVRRLTPTECARLQGFPDWWCDGLGTENPTEEDMAFWREVFETHRKIMGTSSKPKSDSQIRKWLKDPHSDSAEYRMWGNGCSLPIVFFVLSGIKWAADKDFCEKKST